MFRKNSDEFFWQKKNIPNNWKCVGRGMGSGRVVGEAGVASIRRALPNDGKREWRPHCDSAGRREQGYGLENEGAF